MVYAVQLVVRVGASYDGADCDDEHRRGNIVGIRHWETAAEYTADWEDLDVAIIICNYIL